VRAVTWVPVLLLVPALAVADIPARREATLEFPVDEAFQLSGGVQFFFELVRDSPSPALASTTFERFRALDFNDRWGSLAQPTHVVMSRLVYSVDKGTAFFTRERAGDLAYIQAVAPDMGVTPDGEGAFRVARLPSNRFRLQFLDAREVQRHARSPGVALMLSMRGAVAPVDSIVVQENTDFARFMGVRTAEASMTWTAHCALGQDASRITVLTMSYLHSVPPFFLGGEGRVYRESLKGALALIAGLRGYRAAVVAPDAPPDAGPYVPPPISPVAAPVTPLDAWPR
jgi:hypothetical protein